MRFLFLLTNTPPVVLLRMPIQVLLPRHLQQPRLRPLARKHQRRDGRQSPLLHQVRLLLHLHTITHPHIRQLLLDRLLLVEHTIEQVIHVGLCRDDHARAVVVELIDHLHEATQNVRLVHVELRNLLFTHSPLSHVCDDNRVESLRHLLVVVCATVL